MKEMLCKNTLRTNFFFTLTYEPIHAHIYMRKVLKRKLIDRSDNYSTFILKEFHDEMFKSVCVCVFQVLKIAHFTVGKHLLHSSI